MRYLFAFTAPALLAGCLSALSAGPVGTSHTLSLPAPPEASALPPAMDRPGILVVETRAAPGYTTAAMVYRSAPYRLQRFANHRWIDPPAQLITEALRAGLTADGVVVLNAGSGSRPDYRLVSELTALEQDFTVTPSRVVLAVRLQLIDVRARRVVGARAVRLEQTAASDDPPGGVAAANALLTPLTAAARALIANAPPPAPAPVHHSGVHRPAR